MSARRVNVRYSLLALIVSFLREGKTDTASFSAVPAATGKYPFTQNTWGFTFGSEYIPLAMSEASEEPLNFGVTVQFGIEKPSDNRAMAQKMNLAVGFVVRVPLSLIPTQDDLGLEIALLIDKALYETAGRTPIKDFTVDPATTVAQHPTLNWVHTRRGEWSYTKTKSPFQELRMAMNVEYSQPQEEW